MTISIYLTLCASGVWPHQTRARPATLLGHFFCPLLQIPAASYSDCGSFASLWAHCTYQRYPLPTSLSLYQVLPLRLDQGGVPIATGAREYQLQLYVLCRTRHLITSAARPAVLGFFYFSFASLLSLHTKQNQREKKKSQTLENFSAATASLF